MRDLEPREPYVVTVLRAIAPEHFRLILDEAWTPIVKVGRRCIIEWTDGRKWFRVVGDVTHRHRNIIHVLGNIEEGTYGEP